MRVHPFLGLICPELWLLVTRELGEGHNTPSNTPSSFPVPPARLPTETQPACMRPRNKSSGLTGQLLPRTPATPPTLEERGGGSKGGGGCKPAMATMTATNTTGMTTAMSLQSSASSPRQRRHASRSATCLGLRGALTRTRGCASRWRCARAPWRRRLELCVVVCVCVRGGWVPSGCQERASVGPFRHYPH